MDIDTLHTACLEFPLVTPGERWKKQLKRRGNTAAVSSVCGVPRTLTCNLYTAFILPSQRLVWRVKQMEIWSPVLPFVSVAVGRWLTSQRPSSLERRCSRVVTHTHSVFKPQHPTHKPWPWWPASSQLELPLPYKGNDNNSTHNNKVVVKLK